MSKIITITLSPVVDKSASVDKLIPEQKLVCSEPKYEPGGGGVNVSRGLKRLGTPSIALFPAGGATGDLLQALLKLEKIAHEGISTKNSTRENFIVVETSSNQQFRFGMPGSRIYPAEEKMLLNSIKRLAATADYIVASGSIPPGPGADFFAKISRIAKKSDTRFIADTSGEALKIAVEEGVYLLKPNLKELSQLSGHEYLDDQLVEDAARKLISKGKCEVVVVSMGAQGAYLVSASIAGQIQAPSVKKLSTVGAGDSMVAGMVHALSKGKGLREMVCLGVACGTAATMRPGTELFKKEDAERLFRWLANKYKIPRQI
ncbi:1-phosphofructokinase family hexose kinase [Daejeonella sp.]|uniref:1-phosphofructokinase family hexose kinase n=1 Tax=Daejeonella sp. TaxID=2805397 RepID=UPI003983095E